MGYQMYSNPYNYGMYPSYGQQNQFSQALQNVNLTQGNNFSLLHTDMGYSQQQHQNPMQNAKAGVVQPSTSVGFQAPPISLYNDLGFMGIQSKYKDDIFAGPMFERMFGQSNNLYSAPSVSAIFNGNTNPQVGTPMVSQNTVQNAELQNMSEGKQFTFTV